MAMRPKTGSKMPRTMIMRACEIARAARCGKCAANRPCVLRRAQMRSLPPDARCDGALLPQILEELAHLGEEAFAFGVRRLAVAGLFEFAQQLLLALR